MKLINIFFTLLIILFSNILHAGSHQASLVKEDFDKAIKHVEKMRYFDAFQIFSDLAKKSVPEAQYNLALLYSNGLGAPKN